MKKTIPQAMNRYLSGVRFTGAEDVLARVRLGEERTMKKKLSAGFVLAVVCTLLAFGALAAILLTNQEFIEKVMLPIASETPGDSYTDSQLNRILAMAEEDGVTLSKEAKEQMAKWENKWKEEVIMLFAKEQFGPYPGQWSLAQQAWLDQVMVEIGFTDRPASLLPGENDKTEAEILALAQEIIEKRFGETGDVTDESRYTRFLTFGQDVVSEESSTGRFWRVTYMAVKEEDATYCLTFTGNGLTVCAYRVQNEQYTSPMTFTETYQALTDAYGAAEGWSKDIWVELYAATPYVSARGNDKALSCLMRESYADYLYGNVSREQAIALAQKTVNTTDAPAHLIYLGDDSSMVWKATFTQKDGASTYVEMDVFTGLVTFWGTEGEENWYNAFVRHDVLAECGESTETDDELLNLLTSGKPALWGSSLAPQEFWQKMEQLCPDAQTAMEKAASYVQSYGTIPYAWPVEAKAVYILWRDGNDESSIAGVPTSGDMAQAEAEKLAWAQFTQATGIENDGTLSVCAEFYFTKDAHIWYINFVDMSALDERITAGSVYGSVKLDARTGEILEVDTDTKYSNG